ncbi:MAG: SurA N-terminal domain-containing protein [Novosphingobium sp.]|nr:SurA N-terminal domain-containing protein [Novosphingobium sp.]
MFQSIRNFIGSKFGAAVALGVLLLIAVAFASGDVANTGSFGGVTGGDRVAMVGDERVDNATLSQAATSTLERVRETEPTMSMKGLLADGGLERILDEVVDRMAIAVFGKQQGIIVSDRLIDSEITKISAFRGADGKFSEDNFRQALRQRGISEKSLRDDLEQSLAVRQVMIPANFGAIMPNELAMRYAALLSETREGEIAVLPSMLFAAKEKPSDKEIAAYYAAHGKDFIRPERRVVRYASFDVNVAKQASTPTEAEIASRYKSNAAQYQASETRQASQLVVPTEAAANVIVEEVARGTSLEAAAKAKGLSVAMLTPLDRAGLTRQSSKAVSDAVFSAARGGVASPARSPLGWHLMRIDQIKSVPARTLDQVRGELAKQIAQEKETAALTSMLEEIEEEFGSGANLVEVAKGLEVEVIKTEPLTTDGKIYRKPGASAPPILESVLQTAFVMDLEEPQLAIIDQAARFVIFDVTDIAASAPAPLAEIKDDVQAAYILDKASAEARKAAERVQAEVRKGTSLRKAMASIKKRLLPPQPIRMSRPQLMQIQQQGEGVPEPIALMFQMAEGTVKVQAAQGKQAWFIIQLRKLEPGKIEEDDPSLVDARRDLGRIAGDEYAQALQRAIRSQVGVEKNKAAIKAVGNQLGGGS